MRNSKKPKRSRRDPMDTDKPDNNYRSLVISDFRNLGVSALRKNRNDRTFLKINRSLEKDELGGLVIILGGNNCGKSNVLDAVSKCTKQEFDDTTDKTDFIQMPKKPSLELDVAGGIYGKITPPKISTGTGKNKVVGTVPDVLFYVLKQKESFELFNRWMGEGAEHRDDIEYYMNRVGKDFRNLSDMDDGEAYAFILRNRDGLLGDGIEEIANALESNDLSRFEDDRLEILVKGTPIDEVELVGYEKTSSGNVPVYVRKDRINQYRAEQGKIKDLTKKAMEFFGKNKKPHDPFEDVMVTDLSGGVKETELIPDGFSGVYGYNLSNNVYKYRQREIRNEDLTTDAQKPNEFMTKVFSLLGYENKSIVNRYYENKSIRRKLEEELNVELKSVSAKLNRLLNSVDKQYDLNIRLEKSEIIFSISCGDGIDLNLDHQSEGFRWIFGFFVNFLMSKKFVAGDMIVIDEFGGLLNFGTVAELADILREFAKQYGITFIMATQNPMAVDVAHLDEVRMVVPKPDGESEILNDFTEFGKGECMDVLRPIVSSMTIGRNFLRSEKRSTVFVENYLDYFCLSGFNSAMGYDLDFIPVNGITEFTSPEQFAGALKAMERNPILLADTSKHDQASLDELTKLGVQVYTVSEIFDGQRCSVSELFGAADAARFGVEEASFDEAACLSYRFASDPDMTEETKENYRRLFDYISLG